MRTITQSADIGFPTFSDEWIEYWAEQYRLHDIGRHGIRFELFVQIPHRILAALEARGHAPLLPAQRQVQARLDGRALQAEAERGLEHCPRRGGAIVEPLHHQSWSHCRIPSDKRVRS